MHEHDINSRLKTVTESRFYMWRAVFALAHADHKITDEERLFMEGVLSEELFSEEQTQVLKQDIEETQDISEMFMNISEQEDRSQFFYYARLLCWSDGDFDEQEQKIMLKLKSIHVRNVDIDQMIKNVDLQVDDGYREMMEEDIQQDSNPLLSMMKRFSKKS